jgi:hypothetical protein
VFCAVAHDRKTSADIVEQCCMKAPVGFSAAYVKVAPQVELRKLHRSMLLTRGVYMGQHRIIRMNRRFATANAP